MANLVTNDILLAPTFQGLPEFDAVEFKGFPAEKIQYFHAVAGSEEYAVLALNLIRKDDQFLWESCRDLLDRSLSLAEQVMRGIYRFELLCFDVHRELDTFNPQELMQLLTNHARKLSVGGERLIKYSSMYGILKKLVEEDWGKLAMSTSVELYVKEPAQFDLMVKRMMRASENCPGTQYLVINDLSLEPLLGPADQDQERRLKKLLSGTVNLFKPGPRVLVHHKTGTRDLSSEMGA